MNEKKKPFHAHYIDGLRAMAVLAVIAYHMKASLLPGGFAGVDVFFVISGFVVAMSVSGLGPISLPRFLAYFYARRIVRIAPALMVCLLVTFVASELLIPQAWLSSANTKTGLAAFAGVSNFILAANTGNYFSPLAEFNPFTHTWSLAVEEQFYLVFPWLFLCWLRRAKRLSTIMFAVALVCSASCAAYLARTDETQAFYMTWSRFWELGVGVITFQALSMGGHSFAAESPYRQWHGHLAILGLLLIVGGLIVARPAAAPVPACILPVIGTAIVLATLHGRSGGVVQGMLTLPVAVMVGRISYSLYLWHWPVFVLFRWTAGLNTPIKCAAALLLTAILSVVSYAFVEQPPRKAARSVGRVKAITIGLAVIGLAWTASSAIAENGWRFSLSTVTKHAPDWYPEAGFVPSHVDGCDVEMTQDSLDGAMRWTFGRERCDKPRVFPHNVYAIGDSHTTAYAPMFKLFVAQTGSKLYMYSSGGCPFISLLKRMPGHDDQCDRNNDSSLHDVLAKVRPGDVVFLASLRIPRMVDQGSVYGESNARNGILGDGMAEARADAVARAIVTLKPLTDKGALVVFEAPTPMLESIPYRCADWFNHDNPICAKGGAISRSLIEELRAPILGAYGTIAHSLNNVYIWDPTQLLCDQDVCSSMRDGKPLLFDGDHLSGYANQLLLPSFKSYLESLVRE